LLLAVLRDYIRDNNISISSFHAQFKRKFVQAGDPFFRGMGT